LGLGPFCLGALACAAAAAAAAAASSACASSALASSPVVAFPAVAFASVDSSGSTGLRLPFRWGLEGTSVVDSPAAGGSTANIF